MRDEISVVPANEASWEDIRAVFGTRGYTSRCQCQRFKIEACLDRWNFDMLSETLRRPEWDDSWVHTRGSVLQRVFGHDVYHIAQLNDALGAAGLPEVDLWD